MKRRAFLSRGSQAMLSAPFLFNPEHFVFNRFLGSPIVSVFDAKASMLSTSPGTKPNNDGVLVDLIDEFAVNRIRVSNMMDTAIMKFTGQSSLGKGWESLFPAGQPNQDTKISIKINLSYGERREENDWNSTMCPFGPKIALTDAIVHGLSQMLDGYFPVENITIFDTIYSAGSRKDYPLVQGYRPVQAELAGFAVDRTPGTYGIHWVNPNNKDEVPDYAPEFTAAPDYPLKYRAHQRVKRPVFENDFMINVAIAKDHREAGVTGVMKNNYGCTDNPVGTHGSTWRRLDSPYPGTRLCVPVFYKELNEITPCILNIMDCLVGVYHGGPLSGKVFHTNTLTVSKDPLAIDTYLLNLINSFREKNGYAAITTQDGKNEDDHLNASFLRITEERHKLGSSLQNNISTIDLTDNPEKYEVPTFDKPQSRVSDAQRKGGAYWITAHLDDTGRQHQIRSWVEDATGNVVKELKTKPTHGSFAELKWKPKIKGKNKRQINRFVWHTEIDGIRHSRMVNV